MDRYLLRSFIPSAGPKGGGGGGGGERGAGYVHSPESTTNHECTLFIKYQNQNQNQNSLLVKRQTDNTTPGGGGVGLDRRGLVPSSHKRSKFRHTII